MHVTQYKQLNASVTSDNYTPEHFIYIYTLFGLCNIMMVVMTKTHANDHVGKASLRKDFMS